MHRGDRIKHRPELWISIPKECVFHYDVLTLQCNYGIIFAVNNKKDLV